MDTQPVLTYFPDIPGCLPTHYNLRHVNKPVRTPARVQRHPLPHVQRGRLRRPHYLLFTSPPRLVRAPPAHALPSPDALHPAFPYVQHPLGLRPVLERADYRLGRALHAANGRVWAHERLRVEHVHDGRAVARTQPASEGPRGGCGCGGDRCKLLLSRRARGGEHSELRSPGCGVRM